MKKLRRRPVIIALACALLGVIVYAVSNWGTQGQRAGGRNRNTDAPIPVLAEQSRTADVPVYLVGVGTVHALNTVTVRSLVNGTLIKVNFQEGQDVKRGDVLALIDPTTYKAQLDQSVAKKALDEAQLANAKVDLTRYANLVKTNAVTTQQYDTQKALVDQLDAQVKLDQGAIDNAKAYVDWCTITSPINGRLGIRLVDEGNIVSTTDTGGLVVVTQIQPISVIFTLPQQDLGKINAAFAKGPLTVDAQESDNQVLLDSGSLRVINNQIDQTTGTVQLKAEFPNPRLALWPGQFVNIRLLLDTLHGVTVVPTAAVQRGPNGTFVYVVQPDGTASVRSVTVQQQDETQAVIAGGIQVPEQVVTSGFVQLADGRKVTVTKTQTETSPGSKAAPNASGGKDSDNRRGRASEAAPGATQ